MANVIKYEDYEMSMEAVKAYLSYTRTKIAELTERIMVLEEELEKAIEKDEPDPVYFATYSSDDESLNFYGIKGTIPEVGDIYDGKTVDDIYIDFLDYHFSPSSSDTDKWHEHKDTIKTITSTGSLQILDMYAFFAFMTALESIDLSAFDTSLNTSIAYLFDGCTSLTELDLTTFSVKEVTLMGYAFYNCKALKTIYAIDGTQWNSKAYSNVTNSSNGQFLFNNCQSLKGSIAYDSQKTSYQYATTGKYGYFTAK